MKSLEIERKQKFREKMNKLKKKQNKKKLMFADNKRKLQLRMIEIEKEQQKKLKVMSERRIKLKIDYKSDLENLHQKLQLKDKLSAINHSNEIKKKIEK